jgi:hypothetical protein
LYREKKLRHVLYTTEKTLSPTNSVLIEQNIKVLLPVTAEGGWVISLCIYKASWGPSIAYLIFIFFRKPEKEGQSKEKK